jgi:bifunctional UDP-N-acetylglucosamine pyrophosphorylase/glucosamine-1-phosphate N-acetyltransferase
MKVTMVILAAGQGTRMKSKIPKVLHKLCGKPILHYCVEIAEAITGEKPVVVVGHGAEVVKQAFSDRARFVLQQPQLGTGDAVLQTESLLRGNTDLILVVTADMPLLQVNTLKSLVEIARQNAAPVSMLTVVDENARGFGRIVRDEQGDITAIVEEAQANAEQLLIKELNPSIYCFRGDWLWEALPRITISTKGEYYLTDVVELARADGHAVQTIEVKDARETIGINTRQHLAEAEKLMRQRINQSWMEAGVTMIDPEQCFIEAGVSIGRDTIIWPNTYLQGETVIGEEGVIGPDSVIRDSKIGDRCEILASILDRAFVEDDVDIGPYAHLRKGAHLCKGVHMGNFGEVKNSVLGPGTKMGHFSYIGDATIAEGVNIGAGTITCNYDGEKKNQTEIGAGVFIGSDTMLVAPVKLGEGSRTGAGAVVTKDVPPYTLVAGIPARVIRKLEPCD